MFSLRKCSPGLLGFEWVQRALLRHGRVRHLHRDQGRGGGDHRTPDLLQVLQAARGDLQVVHLSFDKFGRTTTEEQTEIAQDIFRFLHKEGYTQ